MTRRPLLAAAEHLLPEPRQTRSIAKRERLLTAGRELFAKRGYEATSIEDITAAAGIASGAFYTYFRSKRQLLIVLMNELLERLGSVNLSPTPGRNVRAGLRRFLAEVFRTDLEYFGVIRAWQEATFADPELADMQKAIGSWTEGRILAVLQVLQKQRNARADRDLPRFARMMDRHFWSLLARGSTLTPRDFAREMNVAADVMYHYLFRG